MTSNLDPRTAAFTATVEFQTIKSGKAFEWVGVEVQGDDPIVAIMTARAKAVNIAALEGNAKKVAKLNTAAGLLIRVGQEWDASGQLIRFDGKEV